MNGDRLGATVGGRDDEEGLFSRDIDGQLVRLDAPTEAAYEESVTLAIDGRPVTVRVAEPLEDAQGNIVLDLDGRTTPRYTTIHDAAVKAHAEAAPQGAGQAGPLAIPVLCHQPHMTPVAVCRLCTVQLWRQRNGKRERERKLVPACQHRVADGMEVFTMNAPGADGDRVRRAVRVVTELLAADHLEPVRPPAPDVDAFNELKRAAERCGLQGSRFRAAAFAAPAAVAARPAVDDSSPVLVVDHSACILCERCSRACNEVKQNHVIGRTGKGAAVRIGFDLDVPMGQSTCVQCGECMVSCPTSAITFRPVAKVRPGPGARGAQALSAAELSADPRFAHVPPKFLLWQEGLVIRRQVEKGDVLCRQGQPGNTAFVLERGRFRVRARTADGQIAVESERGPEDVVIGEMSCLSGSARTAEVSALEAGEVWEVRRNVLDRMMRSPSERARFETLYQGRALELALTGSELFRDLPAEEARRCVEVLGPALTFVSARPGQVIFEQGDVADFLYFIRLGQIRVSVRASGREAGVFVRGPGGVFGEIGLLALSPGDAYRRLDEVERSLVQLLERTGPDDLATALPAGRRTATCSALDHVEMARVERPQFLAVIRTCPTVRRRLLSLSLARLEEAGAAVEDPDLQAIRAEYIAQGLFQAQSLLALDLTRCTRCDLCTEACVAQHGTASHGVPITRLLRDGVRFGDYLVATSCRSCRDAPCMKGCPVDSIHRGRHLQIVIEDHCIGCGLCAQNCPYGNIFMIGDELHPMDVPDAAGPGGTRRMAMPKAATCDLCDAEGRREQPLPRCVYACPHDAAIRLTGEALLSRVKQGRRA